MTIKSLEQRKRQKVLLFVALGIIVVAFLVFYFGFLKNNGGTSEEIAVAPSQDQESEKNIILEERLKRITLDFEFLNEKILSFLKIHGAIPVQKGTSGRENPFIP